MKNASLELLELINKKTYELQAYLNRFETGDLNRIPSEGKWSAIMTIHHLMLAESFALAYCLKKLSFNPELIDATKEEKEMETKVPYLLRSPKYKTTAPDAIGTAALDNQMTLKDAFDKWTFQRKELKHFLESQAEERFSKALYKHPLGGKMRLIGMLMFFDGHLDSHTNQIKENFESMNAS